MTWRLSLAILLLALLQSCSRHIAPYVSYYADCGDCSVDEVERLVHEVAERWDLHMIEKGRDQWRRWTGEDWLTIFLFYDEFFDEQSAEELEVVMVTNVDGKLALMFFDENDMPIEELDRFIEDLKRTLASRLSVEFCRRNVYGACDEESALLEEEWQASLRLRSAANAHEPR